MHSPKKEFPYPLKGIYFDKAHTPYLEWDDSGLRLVTGKDGINGVLGILRQAHDSF